MILDFDFFHHLDFLAPFFFFWVLDFLAVGLCNEQRLEAYVTHINKIKLKSIIY